jgi:hypothetical protein
LDTTGDYLAALPAPPVNPEGLVYGSEGYIHCGNPMFRASDITSPLTPCPRGEKRETP